MSTQYINKRSTPAPTGDYTSNLVGYWTLEEGSGTSVVDSSGNGYNGTTTNGPSWTTGRVGTYAMSFGAANDYVEIPYTVVGTSDPATWAMWIKPKSTGSGYFFSRGKDGSGDGWSIFTYAMGGGGAVIGIVTTSGGAASYGANSTSTLTTDAWVHVTGVWVPNTSLKIYVNGVLEATTAMSTNSFRTSSVGIVFGRINDASAEGALDEVRMYNRALSDDDVAALYATY